MKNAIAICLLSAVLLACSLNGYGQWSPLTSGTTEYLHGIYFKDAQKGYCVGGGDMWAYPVNGTTGVILKTTDGGSNWATVYEDTLIAMHAVIALEDTVIAFGTDEFGQYIAMRSTDDGNNWEKDTTAYVVKDVHYRGNELYMIDNANGGELKRWSQGTSQSILQNVYLFDINEDGDIFCVTESNTTGYHFDLLVSGDGGASWDTMNVDAPIITHNSLSFASLWVFGDTVVFYATYPTAIAYSNNRGVNWTYYNPPGIAPGSGAYVLSPDVMIGKAFPNYIMASGDKGYTFSMQDSTTARISQFHFADAHTGFLCGEDGIIYKTSNAGGATTVHTIRRNSDELFVFPNPMMDVITIALPEGVKMQGARLTDMMGRQLFSADEALTKIDVKRLPAGNYFLIVTTDDGLLVNRLVK